jgi:hypothetical protein
MPALIRSVLAPRLPIVLVVTSLAVGCSGRQITVIGPVPNADGAAATLTQDTRLQEPLQIVFAWRLNEARQRHEGRGVARIEPPYRARLDLFTMDGETVMSAALVDGELRIPPGSRDDILPPTDLMWGTLGIFRPHGVRLLGGDVLEGDAMRLRYAYEDGTELHYQVMAGLLNSMELLEDGHVVQRVEVDMAGDGRYPVEATYRNLTAFRELTIVRESLETHEPFDLMTWDPAG